MKIIIAGAGDVGFHLAKLLSHEAQDIIIIDSDKKKLQHIESHLDVIALKGDATSFITLREANINEADIFIAVTQDQNTNLTAAVIAKKSGAKKSIARINNPEYLLRENSLNFQRMGIDSLISPETLAANEIDELINEAGFNEYFAFEEGLLKMSGSVLDENSTLLNKTVKEVADQEHKNRTDFTPIAIIRKNSQDIIVPRGDTVYKLGDQVYFLLLGDASKHIYKILGKTKVDLKRIMILGGGKIGKATAENLSKSNHSVTLIEKNPSKAFDLADDLSKTLIIQGDGRDSELLEDEAIEEMDAFIAVTGRSETNIMSCLLAKSKGVKKTIALVENMDYIHLSQMIGIDAFINKKFLAANNIVRFIRKGEVLALTHLSNLDAELLEFKVVQNAKITHDIIRNIDFPRDAIIAGVVRNGQSYIPLGDFQIKANDRVVVLALPDVLSEVESLFINKK
ncbi:trk system potassium uptake protein TrkA [Flavobacteriaceae bacterium UJ101]|nr:trk system potassium uptake protein TrkA [Flavobacteriaceae bacterium UJ101]